MAIVTSDVNCVYGVSEMYGKRIARERDWTYRCFCCPNFPACFKTAAFLATFAWMCFWRVSDTTCRAAGNLLNPLPTFRGSFSAVVVDIATMSKDSVINSFVKLISHIIPVG